ncbi:MAG: histidine ammonia-lyase, partial [Candidatus Cloacimonadota bacterium]|nr:histidine ammonia-lyase [Candidatus Cloacimonadota bacterium]
TLTLEQVRLVSYENFKIELTEEAIKKVIKCRKFVDKIIEEDRVVYGLTTGFGKFANIKIDRKDIAILQKNLIESHATAVGPMFSSEESRAIALLRINVLAKGHSGIRLETLQTLIDMLNAGIHPLIPEKGSVGASGDLAQLSHLALVLLGKGEAEYKGEIFAGDKALEKAGITPVVLQAKEGLALNNGTQVMTAIGALALLRAENLLKVADVSAACTIDALLRTDDPFHELIHKLRPHAGQINSAKNIKNLLRDSRLRESHRECANVQDAYSLRCTSQVHGAVRDALKYVRTTIETEINSATDNPLIFPDEKKVISGGNFHGEPVAFACDTLGFTIAELASISERRQEQIFNPALNSGLNAFLAPNPGVDSGLMIAHLTSASLVSENKVYAHPASVDSIPTSANQEDHVSMGTIGAVKARNIVNNVAFVLGIEMMASAQALDVRKIPSSVSIEAVKKEIRNNVKFITKDRIFKEDINKMKLLVDSSIFVEIVEKYIKLS